MLKRCLWLLSIRNWGDDMNESTTITIDNIVQLIEGIAEAEYQRGYVAGLEEKRLTEKHWGKEKEDKTELNNIIKNVHGSIENRINAAYNLGRREGYKEQELCEEDKTE